MDKVVFKKGLQDKMDKALKVLEHELRGLRTGRASIHLLDSVLIENYGSKMPLSQVATLATPDARTISIQVWDKALVKTIEKAIVDANLGLTPSSDGQLIRVGIPSLTEERRKELAKFAHKYGEEAKVSLRNIRRDGNDELKKSEKANAIAKDEHHALSEQVQKLTDEFTGKVDTMVNQKEQEILTI